VPRTALHAQQDSTPARTLAARLNGDSPHQPESESTYLLTWRYSLIPLWQMAIAGRQCVILCTARLRGKAAWRQSATINATRLSGKRIAVTTVAPPCVRHRRSGVRPQCWYTTYWRLFTIGARNIDFLLERTAWATEPRRNHAPRRDSFRGRGINYCIFYSTSIVGYIR